MNDDAQFMPTVSFVIPTFNAGVLIEECLSSIRNQEYPQEKVEIIIVDANSHDNTRALCSAYNCTILDNPYINHPKGRAIGATKAIGELIVFPDSDNILVETDWLRKMVVPFTDPTVVSAEPKYFSFRKHDSWLTTYIGLTGVDDPIAFYCGFYDRYSFITNQWTATPHTSEKHTWYEKIFFPNIEMIPPLGANGYVVRKTALQQIQFDPFWHVSVARQLLTCGSHCEVETGIVHVHSASVRKFIQKKIRRIQRRASSSDDNKYQQFSRKTIVLMAAKVGCVIPILYDTVRGFVRKPNAAWLLHPILTYVVFIVYSYYFVFGKFRTNKQSSYEYI